MAETFNLKKSYSAVNENLAKLFDESGVRRSFTVPYIEGQEMADHVGAVGQIAAQSGGLTNNLITTSHHASGKGWGSGDGHTVGHPADKLRTTVIPKNDENAKAVIDATQMHLNHTEKLLGEDNAAVKTANSQLGLVKKSSGAGMTLLDFGVLITQLLYPVAQAVAKAHSGTKPGGHAPHLRGPHDPGAQEAAAAPQDETQGGEEAPEGAPAAQAAPAAPQAQAAPAPAAQG